MYHLDPENRYLIIMGLGPEGSDGAFLSRSRSKTETLLPLGTYTKCAQRRAASPPPSSSRSCCSCLKAALAPQVHAVPDPDRVRIRHHGHQAHHPSALRRVSKKGVLPGGGFERVAPVGFDPDEINIRAGGDFRPDEAKMGPIFGRWFKEGFHMQASVFPKGWKSALQSFQNEK